MGAEVNILDFMGGFRSMTVDEIKSAITKDNKLPDDLRNTLKQDLNIWLAKIGELYTLNPTMEMCGVSLAKSKIISDHIGITNIFRLHTILGIKLFATKYGENYAIYCNALGYPFIEIISATMYAEVYKSISTLITEVDLFHPYDH